MNQTYTDIVAKSKQYNLLEWGPQAGWDPTPVTHAKGVYFWDANEKRFLDWSSMLVNVNVGHGHPKVIKAIQDQAAILTYVKPTITSGPRAVLAEMLSKITPPGMTKSFFTLGGADANENAMKIARMFTGRQKVITRYRAYHGATFAAMSAGGDPRRLANEPGVPWIVHVHDPYSYRSPLYRGRTREEGDLAMADQIEETVQFEGPENVAAILLEGYNGTSGIIQGGDVYWRRIQEICDKYGILLIVDEVMSGFGRTGEWFGFMNYPFLKPDLIVMAKGLTSGYVPMGAVAVRDEIADYFDKHTLWCGLTYNAHTLACAAAIANLQVYEEENLIQRSREMGKVLEAWLQKLAGKHLCLGDIRGKGLFYVTELVKNRETREPMSPFNLPMTEPMKKVAASLINNGLSTFVRWNLIFHAPPLIVSEAELQEGLDIMDEALNEADPYYEG
jgi:taurine--2-oxoglutarate transaminase